MQTTIAKQGTTSLRWLVAAARYVRMLASPADRDRAISTIQDSFVEGRLTKDELDDRVAKAIRSHDFPELLALISDLPVVGAFGRLPAHRMTPRAAY